MKTDRDQAEDPGSEKTLTPLQRASLVLLGLIFLGSVGARLATGGPSDTDRPQGAVAPALGHGLVAPGQTGSASAAAEPEGLERFLPYLTEGSLFALLGFAVGYATRKVVKLLLIVIAVLFVLVQLLSSKGMLDMDWGGLLDWLNALVFNLKENQTVSEVLTDRIPTSGAFLLGVVLGFRRG